MSDEEEVRDTGPHEIGSTIRYRVKCALAERTYHELRLTLTTKELLVGIHGGCLPNVAARAAGNLGAVTCWSVKQNLIDKRQERRSYYRPAQADHPLLERLLEVWSGRALALGSGRSVRTEDEYRPGRSKLLRLTTIAQTANAYATVIQYEDGRFAVQLPSARKRRWNSLDPQTIAYRNTDRVWVRKELEPVNLGVDRAADHCTICAHDIDSKKASDHRHSKAHATRCAEVREEILAKLPGIK